MNFNRQDIKNWTVIHLRALPTCLDFDNCKNCLSTLTDFECKWCEELNQCSTGTSRSRQDWLQQGCEMKSITDIGHCPSVATIYKDHIDGYVPPPRIRTDQVMSPKANNPSSSDSGKLGNGRA